MIDFSRYCLIWYGALRSLQNHCLIQDGTHTVLLKHHQIQDETRGVLSTQDCEHMHPSNNFLSRYVPLNSIKKQRPDETCCFRIMCSIQVKSTILSPEWMCARGINQLRPVLTTGLKEYYLRCEVWLLLRTGQKHCFETVKNGIRVVACA